MSSAPWSVASLEAILDALPARVSWWDAELSLRYANATALRAGGLRRRELLGRRMPDVVGSWVEENATALRMAFAGHAQVVERSTVVDGDVEHVQVHLLPLAGPTGTDGVVVFSVDQTALVEAQQQTKLNVSRLAIVGERQRIAAELGALVIERMNLTKDELAVASGASSGDSLRLRQAANTRLDDVIASLRSTIRSLRSDPAHPDSSTGERRPVLSTRLLEVWGGHERPPVPQPTHLPADELLRVLDALPAAVTAWDTGFYNTFANAAAVTTYRFGSRDAVQGRQGVELLGQAAYDASLPFGEAAMLGQPQRFVRTLPGPDGGPRSAQIDYVAQVVDGVAVGAVALVLDVTARVRAEEAARSTAAELVVLGDRARIAENLHDLVIQRLFAAGLVLQSPRGGDPDSIAFAVECIDDAMEELRQSVHQLHGADNEFRLKAAVDRAIRQAIRPLGFSPTLHWSGSTVVPTDVGIDVVAVVSEALSNAARHAGASAVDVRVWIGERGVEVQVADDGVGLPATSSQSGLANLAARAARRSGRFECRPNDPRGTLLVWQAPLS